MTFNRKCEHVVAYLGGRTGAALLLTVSHFIFAFHFGLDAVLVSVARRRATFLNPIEPEERSHSYERPRLTFYRTFLNIRVLNGSA